MLVKFNKPFNVLSQFSDNSENATERGNLSDFISIPIFTQLEDLIKTARA